MPAQRPSLTLCGSPLGRAALAVAEHFHTPALVNHCIRSYLWARAVAALEDVDFDDELLFTAAMLHDLGLTPELDHPTLAFEEVPGHLVWLLGAGAGWPVALRERCAEVMTRHMADRVEVRADPEGYLLNTATSIDISGTRADDLEERSTREVLAAYPRLGLQTEFVAALQDQARRKPDSAAAAAIAHGIGSRMSRNPFEAFTPDPSEA